MDWLREVAERKIKEARDRGEFDDLSLQGQSLNLEDLSGIPSHLRVGYMVLKNAGFLPPAMQLRKEIFNLQNLIRVCHDEREKMKLSKELRYKVLSYRVAMKQ